ncbi:MAG: hypothetical protein DRI86_09330 [Bacteroidetes bacterium]|nr:MAG: hypothetical protein DRI86_09330 [Bacteroidota bacterium]
MGKIRLILKTLGEIFPNYILILISTPIVISYFIDSALVDFRYLIINLVWVSLFTIPAVLLKSRFLFRLISSISFIFGFIEITHWIIIKGPLSLTSLLILSNTNLQESIEFFDVRGTYWLLILIPYAILYVLSLRKLEIYKSTRIRNYVIAFVFVFSLIFIGENTIHGRLIRKGVPQLVKVSFSFFEKMKLYKEAMKQVLPKVVEAEPIYKNGKQTFVLILGESCNRSHMSLYGYKRKTTPRLDARNDIYVFKDVVSPYSNTLGSVLCILSESNLENKIPVNESIDIIDIFHSAGFKTFWLSNQSPIGIWDNLVTVFANKSDHTRFVNISSNSSFEATYTTSYDSKLFKPFITALNDTARMKFIVVHLMGSHTSYSKRYPSEFDVFNGDNTKTKTIAEYDNSILYNDFIVDSLLNTFKKYTLDSTSFSSLIYLSDHGENVYDELDRAGHDYSKVLPKANVEIPFMVYLSPSLLRDTSKIKQSISSNLNQPFVSDDLFHTIIDLNNIETPLFNANRSIFNPSYNYKRKRILEDGKDYDLK